MRTSMNMLPNEDIAPTFAPLLSRKNGALDPLIHTGRGSYVFYSKTTLQSLLASYDRAFPDHTECSREEVITGWLAAKQWISMMRARGQGGVQ